MRRAAAKHVANVLPHDRHGFQVNALGKRAVGPEDAAVGGMNEDQIVDRIERVAPLAAGIGGTFEKERYSAR